MKTSEFTRAVLDLWLTGDYSEYMCDCVHEMSRKLEGVYETPLLKKVCYYIEEKGISGFELRRRFNGEPEALAKFRHQFLLNAIKHFESLDD